MKAITQFEQRERARFRLGNTLRGFGRFNRSDARSLTLATLKILCLAKVRFDPLYGLDLIIEDVDPSYTLGDLAAKLARIREHLQKTGIYARNKQLPAPVEFVRIAVISPETSALSRSCRRFIEGF
jgi:hypothetical protein